MIVILPDEVSLPAFDACLVLADQLARAGHDVALDEASAPAPLPRRQLYEAAPFLADLSGQTITRVIVLGPGPISPDIATCLRGYRLAPDARITLTGRFPDTQTRIASIASLAYATGREPQLLAADPPGSPPLLPAARAPFSAPPGRLRDHTGRRDLMIFCPAEHLADPDFNLGLRQLSLRPDLRLRPVVWGPAADPLALAALGPCQPQDLADLPPSAVARHCDIAVVCATPADPDRLGGVLMACLGAGRTVIDATPGHALAASGAPVLRGPADLALLLPYLDQTILPNLGEIARFIARAPWLAGRSGATLAEDLALPEPAPPAAATDPVALFLPTNGVGIGHAQRCCLIGREMAATTRVEFAAFPSCLPLIRRHGFAATALVPRSPDHAQPYANDILNYLRLKRALRPGDCFVFDGGHVFHSVQRLLQECDLRSVWIRRGLWQPAPDLTRALARGRFFDRTIVPLEAFDELNEPPTFGGDHHNVGPIVAGAPGPTDRLRDRLRATFGHEVRVLVVSMLGGGAAADRSAHLQAIAGLCERRPGCLHLVVTWPGATLAPALTSWRNTRAVHTTDALSLMAVADVVVSAAGYNSFHEILYHRIPTLFVPQMAPFMDDQTRRARAAAGRGLARMVGENDLMMLTRELTALLDGGGIADLRTNLRTWDLPPTGNRAAARLIEDRQE